MMDLIIVHDDDGAIHADWLVRCKDCKYALDVHDRANQFSCIAPQASEYCHDAEFFCADGERKSD